MIREKNMVFLIKVELFLNFWVRGHQVYLFEPVLGVEGVILYWLIVGDGLLLIPLG